MPLSINLEAILKDVAKLEKNPMAFLGEPVEWDKLLLQQKVEKRIVHAWLNVLVFNPEKSNKLCLEGLKDLADYVIPGITTAFLLIRATAMSMMGRLEEMKSCLEKAQEQAQISQTLFLNVYWNLHMVSYHLRSQELAKAEILTSKTVPLVDNIDEPYFKVEILWRLASIYGFLRKYDIATFYYMDCYRMSLQHNFRLRALQVSVELVALNSHLRNFSQAESYYKLGMELEKELNIPTYQIGLNFNYGLLHKLQGKLDDAIKHYLISLELYETANLHIPHTLYNIYNNTANAYSERGDGEIGLQYHEKAEQLAISMKNYALQMQSSTNIALAYIPLKRYDEVLPRLKKPKAYYRKTKNWELLTKALRTEGFLHQQTKDYKRGFAVMSKLDEVNIKLVTQIRKDFSVHSIRLMEAHMEDTVNLKTKYALAEKRLEQTTPSSFIGSSLASRKVVENALLAAIYPDTCVFIEGESGTGKEIVAKMIHTNSTRSDKPYVTVNCASISPSLFESEFFGHVRGSFTGASQDKQGFFKLANNGTLFLDEISEMPMEFQAKLLRAIDTKTIIPVGKGSEERVNCKIIAATNTNIHKLIIENRFRLDLFHRINTVEIRIPALRDRVDDIPDLVEFFLNRFAAETKKPKPRVTKDFILRLSSHPFPGNVRELKNYIERLYVMYYQPVWDAHILDSISSFNKGGTIIEPKATSDIKSIEAKIILDALRQSGWKQNEAAKILKLTESTLCRKIKRLGIKPTK
mgnify:CR=1 FL=1